MKYVVFGCVKAGKAVALFSVHGEVGGVCSIYILQLIFGGKLFQVVYFHRICLLLIDVVQNYKKKPVSRNHLFEIWFRLQV